MNPRISRYMVYKVTPESFLFGNMEYETKSILSRKPDANGNTLLNGGRGKFLVNLNHLIYTLITHMWESPTLNASLAAKKYEQRVEILRYILRERGAL